MVTSDADMLNSGFDDLEKKNEHGELMESIGDHTKSHDGYSHKKDDYAGKLKGLEDKIRELDSPDTSAAAWLEVTEACKGVDKDILGTIDEVGSLEGAIDATGKECGDLKDKYDKKEDLHADCMTERKARLQDVEGLNNHLKKMESRLKNSKQALEDLKISEENGQAAFAKSQDLKHGYAMIDGKH